MVAKELKAAIQKVDHKELKLLRSHCEVAVNEVNFFKTASIEDSEAVFARLVKIGCFDTAVNIAVRVIEMNKNKRTQN